MRRMSASSVVVPPTRSYRRSWSTRKSFACAAGASSPISSRNSVPPAASSNRPRLSLSAPVMLDGQHERGGDRGADLDVALVVPVLTRRDEEEPTAGLLTEQQRHAEY